MILTVPELLAKARAGGLDPDEEAAALLERLAGLLVSHGERSALLSRGDLDRAVIVSKHFADALDGLLFSRPGRNASVLDFGAGGGPVGFTWSVLRPDLLVTLLESKHRKARFLRRAAAEPALSNVEIWEGRGEEAAADQRFDMIVSRGVPTDRKYVDTFCRLLEPGGAVLFFKGTDSALAARAAIEKENRLSLEREAVCPAGGGKKRIFLLARLES